MNLIVSAATCVEPICYNLYQLQDSSFALSVHIPGILNSIYVEVDSKVLLGLPFCDKAFVR